MNDHARRAWWRFCLLVGLALTAAAQDRARVQDRPNQPTAAGAGERRAQSVGAPPARLPEGTRVLRDLEYVPGGHERQKLDLYWPEKGTGRPLIVWVHGGAFRAGNKEPCPAIPLLREGYAVASLNYRLSQHAIFPAQIEDCKAAILLRDALRQAGVAVQFHPIKGGGHGAPGFNTPEVQAMARDFFAKHLKPAKP